MMMMMMMMMCGMQHDIINSQMQLQTNRGVMRPTNHAWANLEEIINSYVPALPEPRV